MKPYVIVLGNEKGGTGKSTVCMHLIVNLMKIGFSVGSVDIDARQGTLSRYIDNRKKSITDTGRELLVPKHHAVFQSTLVNKDEAYEDEKCRLTNAFDDLSSCDFILVDTPGNDTFLSRTAHSFADTLVTPLNDSFIDLDMLVQVEGKSLNILKPSIYAEMVWEQRKARAKRDGQSVDWIVMRNRLTTIKSRNKEEMDKVLTALSKRIGFRVCEGFCERVIFRELFLSGLTLLDLEELGIPLKMSHVAARQELRNLVSMIKIPQLQERNHVA